LKQYPLSELKPGLHVGAFKVVELYPEGRGGMSRVVRAAEREVPSRQVALKISRTGSNQEYYYAALQKEVEVLMTLDHPGVVRLAPVSRGKNPFKERAIEILGSPWFFGMERLQGGTLESYIDGLGSLTLEEAARICLQVGKTLAHVHARGFSHNDVKPENIVFRNVLRVGERFDPVLIDFGVAAKLVKHQTDGSVVYMAPERLREGRDPSAPETVAEQDHTKADVWSLGILFYRALVGREPFLGITDRSITSAILRAMPESMRHRRRDVPQHMDEFVLEGCLAKDPHLRVSMAQCTQFFSTYADGGEIQRVPQEKRGFLWQRKS